MVIMYLNVRRLLPKMDEIRHRLARSTPPAIVGFFFFESWLDGTVFDGEIHIPGYQTYRKYRNRKGGGIVVYAAENLKVNRRKDLEHEDLEMVWLEVQHKSSRRALIGVVYRPPNSDTSFMDKFEETILLA